VDAVAAYCTCGYLYGHGESHCQRSDSVGFADPKRIVVPSAKVTSFALNARAAGSLAAQPEMVTLVPGVSRSL
jgi:hypothetical protein